MLPVAILVQSTNSLSEWQSQSNRRDSAITTLMLMDSPKKTTDTSQTPPVATSVSTATVSSSFAAPTPTPAPVPAPAAAALFTPSTAKAEQLKDQLYNPDAKLTDLFGELEPKLMLDAIKKTYNPKANGFIYITLIGCVESNRTIPRTHQHFNQRCSERDEYEMMYIALCCVTVCYHLLSSWMCFVLLLFAVSHDHNTITITLYFYV